MQNFAFSLLELTKKFAENREGLNYSSQSFEQIRDYKDEIISNSNIENDVILNSVNENLKRQIECFSQINIPAVIHFLLQILGEGMKSLQVKNADLVMQEHQFDCLEGYLLSFQVFSGLFENISVGVRQQISMSLDVMKVFWQWIVKYFLQILVKIHGLEDLKEQRSVMRKFFRCGVGLVEGLIGFMESEGFREFGLLGVKYQQFLGLLQFVLQIVESCVGKLKESQGLSEEELTILMRVLRRLFGVRYQKGKEDVETHVGILRTHLTSLMKTLLLYNKDNFVRSNIEIRIKNSIFDEKDRR